MDCRSKVRTTCLCRLGWTSSAEKKFREIPNSSEATHSHPRAASRRIFAFWISDGRSEPVAIFFIIPLFRLLAVRMHQSLEPSRLQRNIRIWIRDSRGLILKPSFWHGCVFVRNFHGRIFIPLIWSCCIWICNLCSVDPFGWLDIVGVVYFLLWNEGWRKVFEQLA